MDHRGQGKTHEQIDQLREELNAAADALEEVDGRFYAQAEYLRSTPPFAYFLTPLIQQWWHDKDVCKSEVDAKEGEWVYEMFITPHMTWEGVEVGLARMSYPFNDKSVCQGKVVSVSYRLVWAQGAQIMDKLLDAAFESDWPTRTPWEHLPRAEFGWDEVLKDRRSYATLALAEGE